MKFLFCIFIALLQLAIRAQALDSFIQYGKETSPSENYQYFIQNEGQYTYGYSAPFVRKQETRFLDGTTNGAYSYIDANGKLQTVRYIADDQGFRVTDSNLLSNDLIIPQPVTETPEVAAARARHLEAYEKIKLRNAAAVAATRNLPELNLLDDSKSASSFVREKISLLPQPIQDTPEVAEAKLKFLQRYHEEQRRHDAIRNRNFNKKGLSFGHEYYGF